jgi:zinc-finger binding domain of transposase IS66
MQLILGDLPICGTGTGTPSGRDAIMTTLDIPLGPTLTEERSREIFRRREEVTVPGLVIEARMLSKQGGIRSLADSQSTPSGMVPVYEKKIIHRPPKKLGRKHGHLGSRRPVPTRFNRQVLYSLDYCPHCQGPVNESADKRTRYVEDTPADIQPVVTEHLLPRYWCSRCRKHAEPKFIEALPKSTLGNRTWYCWRGCTTDWDRPWPERSMCSTFSRKCL